MMMLQCSAGHFTTNSSIVSCQKFDCILYYSTNFASVYLYPSCAVSTLRTSTRAIVEPLILCAWLIGYLRKNKSSHMNEKIIRLQVLYNLLFKSCRAAPYRLRKASKSTVDPPIFNLYQQYTIKQVHHRICHQWTVPPLLLPGGLCSLISFSLVF